MTKKHFRDLANALYRTKPRSIFRCPDCDAAYDEWTTYVSGECNNCKSHAIQRDPIWNTFICQAEMWRACCAAVAHACKRHNSAFDFSRFNTACEEGL